MSAAKKWREDFPVGWEKDQYVTRREFTRFMVAVSGALAVGSGLIAVQKSRPRVDTSARMEIGAADEIPVGGVKLFRYPTPDHQALVIRPAQDTYVAYLQSCTHLSCPVTYSQRTGRIECPCHHGAFEVRTGQVLEGPPPRPLPKIALRIEEGVLYAEGFENL